MNLGKLELPGQVANRVVELVELVKLNPLRLTYSLIISLTELGCFITITTKFLYFRREHFSKSSVSRIFQDISQRKNLELLKI